MVALLAGMYTFGYAQDYLNPPKTGEKIIGTVYLVKRATGDSNDGRKSEWYIELLEKAKQELKQRQECLKDSEDKNINGGSK